MYKTKNRMDNYVQNERVCVCVCVCVCEGLVGERVRREVSKV